MIPLVMILLAAATEPAKKSIFSMDDYPAEALRKGEQGQVVADLLINASGGVETCSIVSSSGFSDLDQATCALLQRRARFTPAKDGVGHGMYAVFRTPPVTWSLGSFRGFPVPADYDLTINRAPDGIKLPVEFTVNYMVTQDGKAQDCTLTLGQSAPAQLLALACQTVASAPARIIRDHNGRPVEAESQTSFRFSLDKAQRK